MKMINTLVVVLVFGLGAMMLSDSKLPLGAKQIEPGVELQIKASDGAKPVAPAQMGAAAVARAELLMSSAVPLFSSEGRGGFAANYTGLVGYAWDLPLTPELTSAASWSHTLRTKYAVEIPYAVLQPGDVLANGRAESFGQALVFAGWKNDAQWSSVFALTDGGYMHTQLDQGAQFEVYEMVPATVNMPAQVVKKMYTLWMFKGAVTIQELEQQIPGPYFALRSRQTPGYVQIMGTVSVLPNVRLGLRAVTRYVLMNQGGTSVTLSKVSAVAYGPDANNHGLAGTATSFAAGEDRVLEPGEVYEYIGTYVFEETGSYIVLPSFQANGVAQVPMMPASFRVFGE